MPIVVPTEKTTTPKKHPAQKTAEKKRSTYHHGNLRETLIAATLEMIEESGPENVSMREVAKRAGVSSGAPFRHFENRTALLRAVAEQAMGRLREGVAATLEKASHADPLTQFKAIGEGYLAWALGNPTHFLILSDRKIIDLEEPQSLRQDNDAIHAIMNRLLDEADQQGFLRTGIMKESLPLMARALCYGLARMYIDGHMPEAGVKQHGARKAVSAALDQFVDGIASETWLKRRK